MNIGEYKCLVRECDTAIMCVNKLKTYRLIMYKLCIVYLIKMFKDYVV